MHLRQLISPLLATVCGVALGSGCTTDLTTATKAYNSGDFQGAADRIDALCPTIQDKQGEVGLKVQYDRDRLWVGLEKGKMLADAGRSKASIAVFDYVGKEAADLREIESWYLENPLDVKSWDAKQFAEDIGQTVVGADQTTYLLQPYEMILVKTYACLEMLISNEFGSESNAVAAQSLQAFEKSDLEQAGYEVMQPPLTSIDEAIRGKVPSGKTTDFSAGAIFSLGEFGNAKTAMKDAIDSARKLRAADPRIAFSTVVQWAARMKAKTISAAEVAVAEVAAMSGAVKLADSMRRLTGPAGYQEEWVLILVETGRGPVRKSFDVRFPIVIPTIGGTMFRAVYPYLKFRADDRPSSLFVEAGGQRIPIDVLTSIDAVAARNFQRRQPELWWIPTIRAAIRAIATIVAQAVQDKDDTLGKVLIGIGGALVAELEQPDLRSWSTLPSSQHAAIIPRPADGRITIQIDSAVGSSQSKLEVPRGASIVHIRALNAAMHISRVAALLPKRETQTSVAPPATVKTAE